jgi:hypothetical protein
MHGERDRRVEREAGSGPPFSARNSWPSSSNPIAITLPGVPTVEFSGYRSVFVILASWNNDV